MMWNRKRTPGELVFLAVVALVGLSPTTVRAQFGMGFGYGMGIGGFNYVPSPTDFLNQHALGRAARAGSPANRTPYANNSNSYINRVRDNGFVPSYDVRRRQSVSERPASPGQRPVATATPQPAPAAYPVIPLYTFFDAARKLVWPAEAPVEGDLIVKRNISDEATLSVLDETKRRGYASISSVSDARQKLLDYGRPALQDIRATATPRVADTFHMFMLSLYESLAQAAVPAQMTAGGPPAP